MASKTLFLLIFDLLSSIVLAFSIAAYLVCTWFSGDFNSQNKSTPKVDLNWLLSYSRGMDGTDFTEIKTVKSSPLHQSGLDLAVISLQWDWLDFPEIETARSSLHQEWTWFYWYVTSHEILGPNEVPSRNWDFDIFWYLYVSGVYMWNFSSIS